MSAASKPNSYTDFTERTDQHGFFKNFSASIRVLRVFRDLWVLLFFLTSCSSGATPLAAPADSSPTLNPVLGDVPPGLSGWPPSNRPDSIPSGFQFAARQGDLSLYVSLETGAISLVNERSGATWSSIPAGVDENPDLAGVWKKRSIVPLTIEYTGADRSSVKVARPEDAQVTVSPVQNGARLEYVFAQEALSVSAYITLEGGALQITIPAAEVKETGDNGIVAIQVLPFFGAQLDGAPGYIVYPDGSGMLMRFDSPHRAEVQEISRPIYGDDTLTPPSATREPFTRQPILMPVFGLTTGADAFIGVISQGDFDATVSMSRSGEGLPYNRVWGEFVFRRQGMFSISGELPVALYEPNRVTSDHQIRYYFLDGAQADYVGMAARYREFLMNERGAQRLAPDLPLMNLHFFMGVEQRNLFLHDFITMTTFDDVRAILDDLASANATRLDVTLEGWNKGGADARYPQRLPVEARLGGADGLTALSQSLHARGQRLFLLDNYLDILPGSSGVFPITDAVRGVDGLPVGDSEHGYYLNPQIALRSFAVRDLPRMSAFGVDGLYLQNFAKLTAPDLNPRYPLGRENFAASWMDIAKLARQQLGHAVLDGGNLYALPYADRLENVPLDSTGYDLSDETIPFYQIAAHGLVQYAGTPINLAADPRNQFLRSVEYGAIPTFTLTQNDTALLSRTTANYLWSGQFSIWKDELVQDYQSMQTLAELQGQFIVGHEQLAEDVYQTTFENGARVIVNYSDKNFSTNGVMVSAKDFVILK